MSKRIVYWVKPDDDGWKVQKQGSERASALTDNKRSAIGRAIKFAKNVSGDSQVKIQNQNGKIQIEYTYGHDPRRTKG